jgi:di/tricarboxylate transporter
LHDEDGKHGQQQFDNRDRLMVQGPGGYRFIDFAKVGLPLTVIVGIVVMALAPIVYGF